MSRLTSSRSASSASIVNPTSASRASVASSVNAATSAGPHSAARNGS